MGSISPGYNGVSGGHFCMQQPHVYHFPGGEDGRKASLRHLDI